LAVESKEDSVRAKIGMSIALFAALLVTSATPAFAASKTPTSTRSGSVTPMTNTIQYVWGPSYATSDGSWWGYSGYAYAAGNLYSGPYGVEHITQVCVWYERGGTVESGKACSNAVKGYFTTSGGEGGYTWTHGKLTITSCWDSPGSNDPLTTFHFHLGWDGINR